MTSLLVMGAGLIGARHAKAIEANDHCRLAGVVEPNASLHNLDGVDYFTDLDDVDTEVDGVIIATPTGLHAAHGIAAAARGWHMLIEKPVVAQPDEAAALIGAVKEAGVNCLAGHHRRYHPSVRWLKDALTAGAIGTPVTSSLIWGMKKPDSYFMDNWRAADGSPVMINLIHDLDLLRFVLGEVEDVAALAGASIRGAARVESGAVAMRFTSGATATISFADTTPSPWGFEAATNENPHIGETFQDMWWITGTAGGISFPSLTQWGDAADWSQPAMPRANQVDTLAPLAAQLDHFIAVINGEEMPLITVEDAARSLELTYRIQQILAAQSAT